MLNIGYVNKCINNLLLSNVVTKFCEYILDDKSIKHNLYWSKKLKKFFESKKIISNSPGPNFFLLNFDFCKLSANYVLKKLEKKGIILRDMKIYNMKNKLRVSIGSSRENALFIKTLNKII